MSECFTDNISESPLTVSAHSLSEFLLHYSPISLSAKMKILMKKMIDARPFADLLSVLQQCFCYTITWTYHCFSRSHLKALQNQIIICYYCTITIYDHTCFSFQGQLLQWRPHSWSYKQLYYCSCTRPVWTFTCSYLQPAHNSQSCFELHRERT